jgi:hypothetical protein
MKGKPERRAEERRGSDRRMLAVGKRVKNRWLIEMSLMRRPVVSSRSVDTRHAHAA